MTEVRDWKEDKPIKRGDSVKLPNGEIHEITSIQHVHNRYQLLGVSGWQYGIDSLVLKQPGAAYRYWQDQAAAEKERADKAEERERQLLLMIKAADERISGIKTHHDLLLASLYPLEKEEEAR